MLEAHPREALEAHPNVWILLDRGEGERVQRVVLVRHLTEELLSVGLRWSDEVLVRRIYELLQRLALGAEQVVLELGLIRRGEQVDPSLDADPGHRRIQRVHAGQASLLAQLIRGDREHLPEEISRV